jgi:hypothetical protein
VIINSPLLSKYDELPAVESPNALSIHPGGASAQTIPAMETINPPNLNFVLTLIGPSQSK